MSRMPEAAVPPRRSSELAHYFESHTLNGDEHHLRDTIAGFDDDIMRSSIPGGNQNLSLIVGIDQADQIPEHQTLFMTKPGARQNDRSKVRIRDVYRYTGGNHMGFTRLHA